jgi:hypothetical protein
LALHLFYFLGAWAIIQYLLKLIKYIKISLKLSGQRLEGFGEVGCPHPEGTRRLPKISIFLVLVAGPAGNKHQKRIILGGLAALQTSLRGAAA